MKHEPKSECPLPFLSIPSPTIEAITFKIDESITVHVRLPYHLLYLLVRHLLPEVCHDDPEVTGADQSRVVPVKHLKRLLHLVLRVGVFHLFGHHA